MMLRPTLFKRSSRSLMAALLCTALIDIAGCRRMGNAVIEKGAPEIVQEVHVEGTVNAVAFDHSAAHLSVLSDYGQLMSIFDVGPWQVEKSFRRYGGGYSANSLAYLASGQLILSTPVGDISNDSR